METSSAEFKKLFRKMREATGYKQEYVAERLGISRVSLISYENPSKVNSPPVNKREGLIKQMEALLNEYNDNEIARKRAYNEKMKKLGLA